jgi:hypothetical protein
MKGPDQGFAQVTIDGKNKGTFDLYSPTAQWSVQQTFGGLANKSHTLVVQVLEQKNKSASDTNVVVDAFVVDGFIVGGKTTQDNDPSVSYDSWIGGLSPRASRGSYRYSAAQNALASLTFTGDSVNWITAMGPAYGQAQVSIDGNVVDTPDLYAATQQWQVVKSYPDLGAGTHTIQIKVLGTKNAASKGKTVVMDAFSGPITTTGTSVPVSPSEDEDSNPNPGTDGDSSSLFWLISSGLFGF